MEPETVLGGCWDDGPSGKQHGRIQNESEQEVNDPDAGQEAHGIDRFVANLSLVHFGDPNKEVDRDK